MVQIVLLSTAPSFSPSGACVILSRPGKLVFSKEVSKGVPAQGPLGPVSGVRGVFLTRDLPSISGGNNNALPYLGRTLDSPDQHLKRVCVIYQNQNL